MNRKLTDCAAFLRNLNALFSPSRQSVLSGKTYLADSRTLNISRSAAECQHKKIRFNKVKYSCKGAVTVIICNIFHN